MRKTLHVVVGAGIPSYFNNCLSSILRLTADDVLGIYNSVSGEEISLSDELLQFVETGRLTFWPRTNSGKLKTGSLYEANNTAISHARGRYEIISFIQSDMQMMWWSPRIEQANESLLFGAGATGSTFRCLYSQFPVWGKRPDFYRPWSMNAHLPTASMPGVTDVAVFAMPDLIASNFEFSGSEADMMMSAAAAGWTTLLHPFPFLAAIPYPASVRKGKVVGKIQKPPEQDELLLQVAHGFPPPQRESADTLHPIYMEDWVVPNGWSVLLPYWPSDTISLRWWKTRLALLGWSRAISLRIRRPLGHKTRNPASQAFFPGPMAVASAAIKSVTRGGFRILLRLVMPALGPRHYGKGRGPKQ